MEAIVLKTIAALVIAVVLTSCVSTPTNPEPGVEAQINACLPAAITMRQGLVKQGIWSQVLLVRWNDEKPRGHAYTIYLYPPGQNQLWAYDRDWGSTRVRAYKDNAWEVGRQAHNARAIYQPLTSAEYLR